MSCTSRGAADHLAVAAQAGTVTSLGGGPPSWERIFRFQDAREPPIQQGLASALQEERHGLRHIEVQRRSAEEHLGRAASLVGQHAIAKRYASLCIHSVDSIRERFRDHPVALLARRSASACRTRSKARIGRAAPGVDWPGEIGVRAALKPLDFVGLLDIHSRELQDRDMCRRWLLFQGPGRQ